MSDNPLRFYMVKNIIAQNPDAPITVESLSRFLPDTFDLGDDDLAPYIQTPEVEFEAEVVSPPPNAGVEQSSGDAVTGEQDAAGTPTLTMDEARERVRVLHEALAQARGAVMTLVNDQRHARDRLATAIAAFVSGMRPPLTREALVAEEIRRGRFQAKQQRESRPGKSYVDRAAYFGRDNSAAGHVRSNLQYGYRRGAMPASMRGKIDPRYAAASMPLAESVRKGAVAKLPSER